MLCENFIQCTSCPRQVDSDEHDHVNVLAKYSIRDVYKITSKKSMGAVICFYFTQDHNKPFLMLKFETPSDAQAAIQKVRHQYRVLREGIGGREVGRRVDAGSTAASDQ